MKITEENLKQLDMLERVKHHAQALVDETGVKLATNKDPKRKALLEQDMRRAIECRDQANDEYVKALSGVFIWGRL